MLVKFNKPFNVLSQFSDNTKKSADRGNLSDFISIPNIYPVGRLDKDSEGLMLLTDDGKLKYKLSTVSNITIKILKNIKETRKISVIFEAVSSSLAGSNKVQTLFLEKSKLFFLDITFSDK